MWFRSTRWTKKASPARTRYFRPQVLALEDRCLLSAGALDTTFGSGGIVTTNLTSGSDYAYGALLQSNGDIIAYGFAGLKHGGGNALARYTPSGSLDSTFGTGGIVAGNQGGPGITAAALQADGRIVALVGGSLFRYNANGSADATFGSNGVVTFGFSGGNLLIQPSNGDIVVGGQVGVGNDVAFALVRYTPQGTLDSTFGQGGEVVTHLPGVWLLTQSGCGLALDNGDIVIGGEAIQNGGGGVPGNYEWSMARYTANGTLDTTFGPNGAGIVTTQFGNGEPTTSIQSLLVQPNGDIVAAGDLITQTTVQWALARYDTSGNLDSTFGSGGIVETPMSNPQGDEIRAAALQANGQIVVAGYNNFNLNSGHQIEVGRYNANGSLDSTFGSGGLVTTSIGADAFAWGVAIQSDGKIVAAGYATVNGKSDFALVRYLGAPSPSFSVTGFPSSTTAGVANTITFTALNGDGSTNTNYTGTVHFTSSDAHAVLPADYTFTAADLGVHAFSATLVTAGSQSITATDTATSSTFGSETGIAVNPAPASSFVVSGYPTSITQGTAGTFTITAVDPYGNVATGYTGTVQFSSSDPLASLPANYTFTATDAGVHTFSATLNTVGTESLTATDTLNSSITGIETGITVNKTRGH